MTEKGSGGGGWGRDLYYSLLMVVCSKVHGLESIVEKITI